MHLCATVLGLSTTAYFIFYTSNYEVTRLPIVFGQNYDSDTSKLSIETVTQCKLNGNHVDLHSVNFC